MRISTTTIFDLGVAGLQRNQANAVKTQQQLSTGRRILTPADDPIASAQALQVSQADGVNTQLGVNRSQAQSQLQVSEASLKQVGDLIQSIRERAVAAGDGALSGSDLKSIAADVSAMYEELIGVGNATDGGGNYLFSGFQGSTQPFVRNAAGTVQFVGDDGQRLAQVGASRQVASNVSGADVFERMRTGNGTFTWAAAGANTGSGIIGPGTVVNPALVTGHNYQITFTVAAGATTYDVVDTTTATPVLAAQPYAAPSTAIAFDGISVNIEGSPANGDSFSVSPSTSQSIFTTVQNLVTALNGNGGTPLANNLGIALTNLDQALDQVLGQRALIGSHLKEIDALNSAGDDLGLQYKSQISKLQDVDYAKAISDLNLEQTNLEAARQSFLKITQTTLFDYLR
ncbi:MAG TPA: flagellar hook-associated protein FlgL [Burkholderiales bacterium]|nr:flagellar hook-associated protein FlgL [Burkholderiales bacterium]